MRAELYTGGGVLIKKASHHEGASIDEIARAIIAGGVGFDHALIESNSGRYLAQVNRVPDGYHVETAGGGYWFEKVKA